MTCDAHVMSRKKSIFNVHIFSSDCFDPFSGCRFLREFSVNIISNVANKRPKLQLNSLTLLLMLALLMTWWLMSVYFSSTSLYADICCTSKKHAHLNVRNIWKSHKKQALQSKKKKTKTKKNFLDNHSYSILTQQVLAHWKTRNPFYFL